jgi:hypothetical protein
VTILLERPYLLAQDFRVEERFGFDSHLPRDRISGAGGKTKRIEHPTSNIEQPTSKDGNRFSARQCHEGALAKYQWH